MEFNIIGAKKDIKKAEKKDFDLKQQQDEANKKANEFIKEAVKHKAKAEAQEEAADKTKADENWHLKDK